MEREIEYKGEKYTLEFNLNVMEDIQEEYGTFEKWADLTEEEEPNIKAIKFGLGAMINEGIEIYNEEHEDKRKPFTSRQIGRLVTEVGLEMVTQEMNGAVVDSTKSEEKN